jgi:hypothetical protein
LKVSDADHDASWPSTWRGTKREDVKAVTVGSSECPTGEVDSIVEWSLLGVRQGPNLAVDG